MTTAIGVHVADDVEQGWEEIGPYALHLLRAYAAISGDAVSSNSPMHGIDNMEAVRASGVIQVLTPVQCIEIAKSQAIALIPLIAGVPPQVGWKSLELFADRALPHIQPAKPPT